MKNWLLLALVVGACLPADPIPELPEPPWIQAAHGTPPTVENLGGPVLTAPRLQPIFFKSDTAMQAKIEDFAKQLAASEYWTATTAEYGVGKLTVLPTIVSSDVPPKTETELGTWLAARLDGSHTATGWPLKADAQTIYAVFTPSGAAVTGGFGDSCQHYMTYHNELVVRDESIVYTLLPRCGGIDDLTSALSHALIETATDPFVETNPAWASSDIENVVMYFVPGTETPNYCELLPDAKQRLVGNYLVQRTWSNAASNAGNDPCVPAPSTPYVAAVPMFNDWVEMGDITWTKGIVIAVGETQTVNIQLISDVPTGAFEVNAIDVAQMYGLDPELTFQWNTNRGINGDYLELSITRVRAGGLLPAGSEFFIESTPGTRTIGAQPVSMWYGFVAEPK